MSRTDSRWTLNPPQPHQPDDFYGPHPELPVLSYFVIEIPGDLPESFSGYFKAETARLIATAPDTKDAADQLHDAILALEKFLRAEDIALPIDLMDQCETACAKWQIAHAKAEGRTSLPGHDKVTEAEQHARNQRDGFPTQGRQ